MPLYPYTCTDCSKEFEVLSARSLDRQGVECPSCGGTNVTLDAGTYNVIEQPVSGYTDTYSADCKNGTIANGQTKYCTVTNDDQAAHLVVCKHVINDNGGQATAADFTLDSGGTNDSPDDFAGVEPNPVCSTAGGTNVTLNAGSPWTVTAVGKLKELWDAGVTPKMIGHALGRPEHEVRAKAAELRLPQHVEADR